VDTGWRRIGRHQVFLPLLGESFRSIF
jgi:hypothetical protein